MRVTSKGQVTIPQHIREALGILPNSNVEWELVDGGALVRTKPAGRRGQELIEHLRKHARRSGPTPDEIMAMTRGED